MELFTRVQRRARRWREECGAFELVGMASMIRMSNATSRVTPVICNLPSASCSSVR